MARLEKYLKDKKFNLAHNLYAQGLARITESAAARQPFAAIALLMVLEREALLVGDSDLSQFLEWVLEDQLRRLEAWPVRDGEWVREFKNAIIHARLRWSCLALRVRLSPLNLDDSRSLLS